MNQISRLTRQLSFLLVLTLLLAAGCSTTPETLDGMTGPLTEASAEEAPSDAPPPLKDSDVIPILDRPTLGPKDALVTIVMFTDLQCPYCKRAAQTMTQLLEKYPSQIKIVLKHQPLPMHAQAREAAYAVVAADQQGKAWEMHDLLFENQREMRAHADDMRQWTTQLAGSIGLDTAKFQAALDDVNNALAVEADVLNAKDLNVRGTPYFFVNGAAIRGAQPIQKFEAIIDEQLAIAKSLLEEGCTPEELYREAVALNYSPPPPKPIAAPKANTPRIEYVPVAANDPVFGNTKDPLVTIVEFSDFQCPFCARVNPTVEQIKDEYGDQIRFVFKQLPLEFHRQADPAARAALAAHQQGKFWEMHDLLFENQQHFKSAGEDFEAFAAGLAKELGLNVKKFKKDYHSEAIAAQVERDLKLVEEIGVKGTPNFWINGVNLRGAQPYEQFKSEIDRQLQKAKKLKADQKLSGDALYKAAVELNKAEAPEPQAAPKAPKDIVDLKDLALGNAPVKGAKNAPVTIVTFSDFQCPYCKRGDASLKEAVKDYDGKVKIAFKHYPLPFHKAARPAARAAMAAGEQGKFWEMHDLLFENQKDLSDTKLYPKLAKKLGLDVNKFEKDMKSPDYDAAIEQDMAQGAKIGVRGTPAFFIDGERIVGAQPAVKFKEAIERALEDAK